MRSITRMERRASRNSVAAEWWWLHHLQIVVIDGW
jgi:hypothetical protein